MGYHAREGREANKRHTYQANNYVHGTSFGTTGYLAEIKRIEKDSDPGPKKDAALTPLREQAQKHDALTRQFHHDNVKAALENLEKNRPAVIQRAHADFTESERQKTYQARSLVRDMRTAELLERAKMAAEKRDNPMLYAIRAEVQARLDNEAPGKASAGNKSSPWGDIVATLDSAHAKELRAAIANLIGAQHAQVQFKQHDSAAAQMSKNGERGFLFANPAAALHELIDARSYRLEDGTITALVEDDANILLVEAGAIDVAPEPDRVSVADEFRHENRRAA